MNKLIELTQDGFFAGDYPYFGGGNPLSNWTKDYPPSGLFKAKYTGKRQATGEWVGGQWIETVENHIGEVVYNTTTKESLVINQLGPIPEGYTDQVPREFDYWDGSLWITDLELRNRILKARKIREINNACEESISVLRSEYPDSEVISWSKQEIEARKALTDPNYPTPLVDLIAEARGMDRIELINKIIQKSDQYAYAVGLAIGRRQYIEDRIKAISIGEESMLDQITF